MVLVWVIPIDAVQELFIILVKKRMFTQSGCARPEGQRAAEMVDVGLAELSDLLIVDRKLAAEVGQWSCAGSSHRGGQATLAAFWPPNNAQHRHLLRASE